MFVTAACPAQTGADDRAFAVQTLTRIAEPVLSALAGGKLKATLPTHDWEKNRTNFAPLEAFGRSLAGIAPWLELGPDDSAEGKVRAHFIDLTAQSARQCHRSAFAGFSEFQPRRPAAGGHGLSRAGPVARAAISFGAGWMPNQRSNLVAALKSSRVLKPGENNWLLFSATIEAALWQFTGECEREAD